MSFWTPAQKSLAKNRIHKKSLDTPRLRGIMGTKDILQVLVDFMKVSSHKHYLEIVNSQYSRDLMPAEIFNFGVIKTKSLFSLVNIFFNTI